MRYADLFSLMAGVPEARQYFRTLPNEVKDQICTRPEGINSLESLKDYAENLLRGDE